MMKKIRSYILKYIFGLSYLKNEIILQCHNDTSESKIKEVMRRMNFFFNDQFNIKILKSNKLPLFFNKPIFSVGFDNVKTFKFFYRGFIYDVDYDNDPNEAWEYHNALTFINKEIDFLKYQQKLSDYRTSLDSTTNTGSYVFGTGPSLENAINREWQDGFKVVCNTIGKDKELWHHINPHAIVCGDGIYHFGIGDFAVKFREDLKCRLKESSTIMIYPSIFHTFVLREFSEFSNRLYPIPIQNIKTVHHDLMKNYSLPQLENILPLLLLPVACTFSKNVFLWGFDGRAPKDQDFWKNSNKHFYQEYVDQLKVLHPAFFTKQIPANSQKAYVEKVHGQVLEDVLSKAEKNGYVFEILHKTFTPVLAKRHNQL